MATVRGRETPHDAARAAQPGVWMEGRVGKNGRIAHLWMPAPADYRNLTAACGLQAYRGGLEPAESSVHHCKLCVRMSGVECDGGRGAGAG